MISQTSKIECPRSELAAYIDGELSPHKEIELEKHLAACRICASELNEQKRFLCALDFALEGKKEFALPENFTKIVVANAESKVSGLRSPKERLDAIFVIAALFLTFLLSLGGEVRNVAATFVQFGEQLLTVGGFTWHLVYNIAFGTAILLRSISSQVVYNSPFLIVFLIALFFAAAFALARFINRFSQTKI